MVNLLPKKTIKELRRTYYIRLTTAFLVLIAIAFAVGNILLVPTYVVSERAASASERYLAAIEETIGVRERAGVTDDVRALTERLRILDEYAQETQTKAFFEDTLSNLPSGVVVTGIGFSKGEGALGVSVAGRASTRASLLEFVEVLQGSGKFDGVTVPVAQLALDSNIPFSITATYRSAP